MKQEHRHIAALVLAWTGWVGAVLMTTLRVTEVIPVEFGVLIVLMIGVAIAAGVALSRMRLARTMSEAFQAGLNVTRKKKEQDYSK